jgi:hypothetical protein
MDSFLLQDYITLSNPGPSGATITQGASSWLDVSRYEDLVFYVDVKSIDVGTPIFLQTAPTREEKSFLTMVPPIALVNGTTPVPALAMYCQVPAAAYVRWQIPQLADSWNVTLGIWVAAYSVGC